MDVVSFCALPVASLSWQPRLGAHALTVICKATFELQPGESPLSTTQEIVWNAAGPASDLVPFKRGADVFVVGRAYPPDQKTVGVVASLVARFGVGGFQKTVEVRSDRGWALEAFTPVAPIAPLRTALLGRYAASWDHQGWAERPLPEDFNGAYFNAAPVDQQLAELVGDERLLLEHLHPLHARLETKLARVVPQVTVRRTGKPEDKLRMRCDTLAINTDRRIAMLVWRGVVLLEHAAEDGFVAVRVEGAESHVKDDDATKTIAAPLGVSGTQAPVLPFGSAMGGGTAASTVSPPPQGMSAARFEVQARNVAATTMLFGGVPVEEVLPVTAGGPSTPTIEATYSVVPRPPGGADDGITTIDPGLVDAARKPATPFGEAGLGPTAGNAAPPVRTVSKASGEAAMGEPAMPFDVPRPALLGTVAKSDVVAASIASEVEKPPLLGPIARVEKPTEDASADRPASQEVNAALKGAPELESEESIELTLEQVAAIAAELAEGKQDRAKVLDAHGLRERIWRKNERRWLDAIDVEAARGTHTLRAAYDAAYVAKIEELRGPITVEEYARIAVGLERGQPNDVLDALRIHRLALMPLIRLWTRKVAKDMKLGDAATSALRVARRA